MTNQMIPEPVSIDARDNNRALVRKLQSFSSFRTKPVANAECDIHDCEIGVWTREEPVTLSSELADAIEAVNYALRPASRDACIGTRVRNGNWHIQEIALAVAGLARCGRKVDLHGLA